MFRRNLVAMDGSAPAERAMLTVQMPAKALSADVALLHVLELPTAATPQDDLAVLWALDDRRKAGKAMLRAAADRMGGGTRQIIESGVPADVILATAEQDHADLIALGAHGRKGWQRLTMGSTAEAVIRSAECPVLTVRATEPSP